MWGGSLARLAASIVLLALLTAPRPAAAHLYDVYVLAPAAVGAPQLAAAGTVVCWGNPQAWMPLLPAAEDNSTALTTSTSEPDDGSRSVGGALSEAWDGRRDAAAGATAGADDTWMPMPLASSLIFNTISAEDTYACGLTIDGAIACFGSTTPLQPDRPDFLPPTKLPSGDTFMKVATGSTFACGLLSNFSVACFGRVGGGQPWTGLQGSEAGLPPLLVAGGMQFVELVAGSDHVCGILFNGSAACFGSNAANQLGHDSALIAASLTPLVISDPSLAFTSLAAADTFSCGVLVNGSAACWGGYTNASQSELLPAAPRELRRPGVQPVVGEYQFASLSARGSTACGLTLQRAILCVGVVGSFIDGQGYPETLFSATPTPVPSLASFTQVTVGGSGFYFHACGLTAEGTAICWGLNNEGQLGVPPAEAANSTAPLPVATSLLFSFLSAGGDYTCGVVAA